MLELFGRVVIDECFCDTFDTTSSGRQSNGVKVTALLSFAFHWWRMVISQIL